MEERWPRVEVRFDQGVTPAAALLQRRVGEELVLLQLESEQYYGLDEVGTAMWEALVSHPTIDEAFDALLREFEVDPGELRGDLTHLVDQLSQRRLIEVTPA